MTRRALSAVRFLGVVIAAGWLHGEASAQLTPVDQLYCNVTCAGPAPDAQCRLGIAGGSALRARRSELEPLPGGEGLVAGGNLAIPTSDDEADDIVLAEAYLEFRFSQPRPAACTRGFDIVRGQARLPVPAGGVLADADIEVLHQPMASVGFDVGRNLIPPASPWCAPGLDCACQNFCLQVPVPRTDKHYFFFDVDARYSFRIGIVVLDSPGAAATLILDPTDPYFFMTGSVMGIPGIKTPLNAGSGGFGFSYEVDIPYVPVQTYGIEDRLQPFRGDYAAALTVPLFETTKPRISVGLTGEMVVSMDPDQDGDHPFYSPAAFAADPDLALGANGLFSVSWSPFESSLGGRSGAGRKKPTQKKVHSESKKAKKANRPNPFLGLDLQLASASAGGRIHPDYSEIFVSGSLGAGTDEIFPSWMPLPVRGGASVSLAFYGTTGSDESYFVGRGDMEIDPTFLGKLARAGTLPIIRTPDAELRVDKRGFRVVGTSTDRVHRDVEPQSPSEVELLVAPNGFDSHLAFRGPVRVAGEDFAEAELILGPTQLGFATTWQLDAHTVDLEGRFTSRGGKLTGSTQIEIPYSREDTLRKLQLLQAIAKQQELVDGARLTLGLADAVFSDRLAAAQTTQRDLDLAIAAVTSWEIRLAQLDVEIQSLEGQLAAQVTRNCNADYTGCRSCSNNCDCSCGALDLICKGACAVCTAAYGVCLAERETCRVANIVGCNADRTFHIARLGALIAVKGTERLGIRTAHDVALAVLRTARDVNSVALNALTAATAAVQAAQAGLDAGLAALERYQDELDNLPDINGTVTAVVGIEIKTSERGATKKGKITALWNGRRIARGRVDLDAQPKTACITIPIKEVGEICTVL